MISHNDYLWYKYTWYLAPKLVDKKVFTKLQQNLSSINKKI